MTIKDLFSKELSNIYAMLKQTNHYFNGSEISFLPENIQLLLVDYVKLTCSIEELVTEALKSESVNPGNTTDSIIEEITENLSSIANEEIENDVKAKAYIASINRLMGYQIANLQNIKYLNSQSEVSSFIAESEHALQEIKTGFLKQ